MEDYKRESFYGDDDFKDYEFISDEGTFECEYVGRWMNKDENLVLASSAGAQISAVILKPASARSTQAA